MAGTCGRAKHDEQLRERRVREGDVTGSLFDPEEGGWSRVPLTSFCGFFLGSKKSLPTPLPSHLYTLYSKHNIGHRIWYLAAGPSFDTVVSMPRAASSLTSVAHTPVQLHQCAQSTMSTQSTNTQSTNDRNEGMGRWQVSADRPYSDPGNSNNNNKCGSVLVFCCGAKRSEYFLAARKAHSRWCLDLAASVDK